MKLWIWQQYVRRFCTRKINGDLNLPALAEWIYDNLIAPPIQIKNYHNSEMSWTFEYNHQLDYTDMTVWYKDQIHQLRRTRYDYRRDDDVHNIMLETAVRAIKRWKTDVQSAQIKSEVKAAH